MSWNAITLSGLIKALNERPKFVGHINGVPVYTDPSAPKDKIRAYSFDCGFPRLVGEIDLSNHKEEK